jgi:hypothetical protein
MARKEAWLQEVQKEATVKVPKLIKLTYELVNLEVERQRKFFNGPVVDYFAIQSGEILEGKPEGGLRARYRETILDESLGYDVELVGRTTRRRRSTSDFRNTQKWHDFLETIRETLFEPNGYEFPDSEHFWRITSEVGEEKAKEVVIKQLQDKIKKKLSTTGDK